MAEQEEIASLYERKVWEVVPRTPDQNVLGCRFVYKKKRNPDRSVYRWKCRLVAQGFKQIKGIDFNETFASTVNMQSVRLFYWVVARMDLELYKIDIKTFFLYGELDEVLYMEQPPGYEQCDRSKYVCKLIKSIYGTKQAMRCANKHLGIKLKRLGFKAFCSDEYVFILRNGINYILLCNFVDDIACATNNTSFADTFITNISKVYTVTVQRDPTTYLSFEIERDRKCRYLKIHQAGYIKGLAVDYGVADRPARPIPFTASLPSPKSVVTDKTLKYQNLVGSLIWLLKTRQDVAFYVGVLCRYMSCYDEFLYSLALKLLVFLNHTSNFGVVYSFKGVDVKSIPVLEAYADADWGGRVEDSKSTTGWLLVLDKNPVFAASSIQRRPALSTAEAEFNAMETTCKEIEWTKGWLSEVGLMVVLPVPVYQDNEASIRLSKDPVKPARTKYFRIVQDYVRWCYKTNIIMPVKIASADHPCDLLNKMSTKHQFLLHTPVILGKQNKVIGSVNMARWKQTGRPRPKTHWRRMGSRLFSRSDSNPPMACRCNVCKTWFPWSKTGQRWLTCWEREVACDNNDDVLVQCFQCMRPAEKIRGLENGWYCSSCPTPRLLRTLPKRTNRYGQSAE